MRVAKCDEVNDGFRIDFVAKVKYREAKSTEDIVEIDKIAV